MSRRVSRRQLLVGTGAAALGTALPVGRARTDGGRPTRRGEQPSATSRGSSDHDSEEDQDLDLDGLESVVDEAMETGLDDHDIVGAAVSVVHDDEIALSKGYGEAGDDEPVEADETVFRIGSVSKPIVWTAVMQLIEDGRIDPDEDVTTYLESVSIPDTYDEPITMAHLATHTAGFEERFRGTWVEDPDDLRTLPEVLSEEQPKRVRPPGEIVSYSNYGTALAAQVVADVADTSFEEYVEENVFQPLGMESATFTQPYPDDVADDLSTGYTAESGSVQEAPDLFFEIAPAGSMALTATEMAPFVRAHLSDGTVDDEQLLESSTIETMHDQWFTHHEALDGVAFGWFEDSWGETRILEHDGAIPGSFTSRLVLVPEYDLGVFVVYNTNSGAVASGEFVDSMLEEYVPREESDVGEPDGQPARAEELAGSYRGVRIAESTHAKLASTLQAGTIGVSVDGDGYLVTDRGGTTTRWVEREPLVFDEADGDETLAFGERNGEITYLFDGFQAYERISWHESLGTHFGVGSVATLGMLSGTIGWPIAEGWRRLRGEQSGSEAETESVDPELETADPEPRSGDRSTVESETTIASESGLDIRSLVVSPAGARWIAGMTIACLFGFVVGFLSLAGPTLLSNPPLSYTLVSTLPVLGLVGTLAAGALAVQAWRAGWWGRVSRLHYTIVVLAMASFCWLLYYWNFLRVPV